MAYASWSVSFGEQPSAAKWNILGTNDAFFDGLVGSGTAWTSWTPTLSGRLNDAKWTKTCKYQQFGKTVMARLMMVASNATPMDGGSADALFTLPVTSTALTGTANTVVRGCGNAFDATGNINWLQMTLNSTTIGCLRTFDSSSTYLIQAAITSTIPYTWTTSDEISATFVYEAA